ncbi:MAG: hypothetical protein Q4A61_02105 [Porphyromonadaceae bacterium]|nr:hypothetical protein [Porphyromonadaceae bacterium]
MGSEHSYENILREYEELAQRINKDIVNQLQKERQEKKLNDYDYRDALIRVINTPNEKISNQLGELINKIEETEARVASQARTQYRGVAIGVLIVMVTLLVIVISSVLGCITANAYDLAILLSLPLILAIIVSHLILRFYQQSISLQKELLEKKLGTTFLRAALQDASKNEKMYEFGVQMFLRHHITSEPYGPKDKIISVNIEGGSEK